ncbi:MAG: tRNA (guanosine(37)-N1)-methyltransferase TrmD [Pseudomonadales bacterium]|nr:tRNA (guanosine(37)-N1)-methyltransferase TrmD [Pseudomonadales bacterium]
MWFGVVTLFPELLQPVLTLGVTGRAIVQGLLQVECWNPRQFTSDLHQTVDDRPYGGGPGMVMKVAPLQAAIGAARAVAPKPPSVVYLSPQGRRIDQSMLERCAGMEAVLLLAGRYEGVDERLIDLEVDEEWSLGDFVLSGGEIAAMALIDGGARLLPGALGHAQSARCDSFSTGLLDHPHYTRPECHQGAAAPQVLLSGDHGAIERWRRQQALVRSWLRRPELLKECRLSLAELEFLERFAAAKQSGREPTGTGVSPL